MASNVLADSGFLVAFLNERDAAHAWAVTQATHLPPPWKTCEAVLSEAFYLLGSAGMPALAELLQGRSILCEFEVAGQIDDVLRLMKKYRNVPMSFADACLVRMSEILSNPTILTIDSDFHVYRRHGRQVIPCVTPR
jgi:uncharacterized protein